MENQENILDLYYNKHLKQSDIATAIGVSKQYVSKIVKKDSRFSKEKQERKNENATKRKDYMKEYFKSYNRPKKEDNSYEQLQAQLKQDSIELSYYSGVMNDYAYVKANSSIYENDKNGNKKLIKGINVGYDVPNAVNMNIPVPTQKYKHKCYSM